MEDEPAAFLAGGYPSQAADLIGYRELRHNRLGSGNPSDEGNWEADRPYHEGPRWGVDERLAEGFGSRRPVITQTLGSIFPTGAIRQGSLTVNAYDEFRIALSRSGLAGDASYSLNELMAQTLFRHRLWVEASRRKERFIGIEGVELRHIKDTSEVWVNIIVPERALVWRGRSKTEVLSAADLSDDFDFVRGAIVDDSNLPLRVFQQLTPSVYGTGRPMT